MEGIYNECLKFINKDRILLNESMSKHTTFKIGGPADLFIKINSIEELLNIISICNEKNAQLTIIGNGSNILVKDRRN